jgi:hypothetical protein
MSGRFYHSGGELLSGTATARATATNGRAGLMAKQSATVLVENERAGTLPEIQI